MSDDKKKDSPKKESWESNPNVTMEITRGADWNPNKKVVHRCTESALDKKSEGNEQK